MSAQLISERILVEFLLKYISIRERNVFESC